MSENAVAKRLKKAWKKVGGSDSLREFAKAQAAAGNKDAEQWFENKAGALNEPRSAANLTRAKIEADATKAARRKASAGKKNKTEAAT